MYYVPSKTGSLVADDGNALNETTACAAASGYGYWCAENGARHVFAITPRAHLPFLGDGVAILARRVGALRVPLWTGRTGAGSALLLNDVIADGLLNDPSVEVHVHSLAGDDATRDLIVFQLSGKGHSGREDAAPAPYLVRAA
ncbi:MAG: hypothetical protein AAF638_00385 [Pseudomonadota bacterium]